MTFRDRLGRGVLLTFGIAYGAGLMYLLDPDAGRRRRGLIRDRLTRVRNDARWWFEKQARNTVHHAQGYVAEMRSRMRVEQVDDDVLRERVRAQVGHVVTRPNLIEFACLDGHVTVRGVVHPGERSKIEKRLAQTRGVRGWTVNVEEQSEPEAAGFHQRSA